MSGPAWLDELLAAVMLLVALASAIRLVTGRLRPVRTQPDIDVSHLVMGVAMAGMLVGELNPFPAVAWEVVFAAGLVWFAWASRRIARPAGEQDPGRGTRRPVHHVTHAVMAAAMIYMYAAPGSVPSMSAHAGAPHGYVALPLVFVVVLLASAVWALDEVSDGAPATASGRPARGALAVAGVGGRRGAQSAAPVAEPGGDSVATGVATPDAGALAPRLEGACHAAMCVTMGYLLVLLL